MVQKCTKCGRDRQGHAQPLGELCELEPLVVAPPVEGAEAGTGEGARPKDLKPDIKLEPVQENQEKQEKQHSSPKAELMMQEMISQMSHMTSAIQALTDDHLKLKARSP